MPRTNAHGKWLRIGVIAFVGGEAVLWLFALAVWLGRRTTDHMSWHDIWVNALGLNVFVLAIALLLGVVFAVFWAVESHS